MLKVIISGIAMVILDSYMTAIYSNRKKITPKNQDTKQYSIQIPRAATSVFLFMMFFGVFLFIFFGLFLLFDKDSTTPGLLVFCAIFSMIGAIIALWTKSWIILVNDNQLEYHSLFHKKEIFTFDQIENVQTDSKGAIGLYINGKRITISVLCENYSYLIESLKEHNKWIEKNNLEN